MANRLSLFSLLLVWSLSTQALSPEPELISPSDLIEASPVVNPSQLNMIEIHQRASETTLVLRLKNDAQANVFSLEHPTRLIIDLPNTTLSKAMPKQIQDNGLIQRIRFGSGPEGNGNLRLVLDLAQTCHFASLIDEQNHQQLITVILTPNGVPVIENEEPVDLNQLNPNFKPETKVTPAAATKTTPVINIHSSTARLVNIVIDPGHGGKDSGAVGANRLQEKVVVLAISQCLVALLNQQPGIHAQLTRTGDYFISLRERLRLARAYHADFFMAIHADAFNNDTATGASVFALSQHGATSEAARWLAERENISEFAGVPFKTTDYQLKSVLLDMSQTATIQDSLALGKNILRKLTTITPLHTNRVEQAGFMVLKSPDIPSVLIETGFISNAKEASLLGNPDYQVKMANILMKGIVSYCQQNPPPDSYFEMKYQNKKQND